MPNENQSTRNEIARILKEVRRTEYFGQQVKNILEGESDPVVKSFLHELSKETAYYTQRTGADYIRQLEGLRAFFDYIRHLESRVVYDVGAGITRGAAEIQHSDFGTGVDMRATVLSNHQEINSWLGLNKTIITPAETMRGIENESVGGILAVASIMYSVSPTDVVNRFDQILCPGGAIKTYMCRPGGGYTTIPYQTYIELWRALKYDVDVGQIARGRAQVIVAIKPGNPTPLTAKQLLDSDYKTARQQVREFSETAEI